MYHDHDTNDTSGQTPRVLPQIAALREEVVNLKTLLLAHKDCPVTQQQGMLGAYIWDLIRPETLGY